MKTKNALSALVVSVLAASACNEKPAPSYSRSAKTSPVTTTLPATDDDDDAPTTTVPGVISGKDVGVDAAEGPHVTLTGALAGSFSPTALLGAVAPSPEPSSAPAAGLTIWALPLAGGALEAANLLDAASAQVDDGLKFELHLPKADGVKTDYLLAVLDTRAASRSAQFLGQVGVAASTAAGSPLAFRLPLSAVAAGTALDLGTLKLADGVVVAAPDDATVKALFADAAALKAAAATQAGYGALRDLYANAGAASYVSATVALGWEKMAPSAVVGAYSDPDPARYFETGTTPRPLAYNISIQTNDDAAPRVAELCPVTGSSTPSVRLDLSPPSGIETGGHTGVTSLGNDGAMVKGGTDAAPSCSDGRTFIAYEGKDGAKIRRRYDFGADFAVKGTPVAGAWRLTKGAKSSAPLASFDFGWASPLDAHGKPRLFIPALKASVDGDRVVTGLAVKWYVYAADQTPPFAEVDAKLVAAAVSGYKLFLRDLNGNSTSKNKKIEEVFDDPTAAVPDTKLKSTWKFRAAGVIDDPRCSDDPVSTTDEDARVDNIGVSYSLGGATYSWVWGKAPVSTTLGQTACP